MAFVLNTGHSIATSNVARVAMENDTYVDAEGARHESNIDCG
jgi:hypothetical protein